MHYNRKRIRMELDEVAKLLGLPDSEDIFDRMMDADIGGDAYSYTKNEALKEGRSEEDAEKAAQEAETEVRDEYHTKWQNAVVSAFESLCKHHNLTCTHKGYEVIVTPKTTWTDVLKPLIETINGVGYFHFGSVQEFLYHGPYKTYEGVATHLGWIKDYPAVYGDASAQTMYERAMR